MKTIEETLAKLDAACLAGWPGPIGMERGRKVRALLARVLPEYAAALGLPQADVLEAIESSRDYSAENFYQEANFPKLADVTVFDTPADFLAAYPSRLYVCPACKGHSSDPYECNSGLRRAHGETCNWKSYGFFGTMGKGMRVLVRSTFLKSPRVHEIFMPIEAAEQDAKP